MLLISSHLRDDEDYDSYDGDSSRHDEHLAVFLEEGGFLDLHSLFSRFSPPSPHPPLKLLNLLSLLTKLLLLLLLLLLVFLLKKKSQV